MSEVKGFLMSLEVAERFFKICAEKQLDTREERIKLMNELIHEENIRILKEDQIRKLVKGRKVIVAKKIK